MCVCVCVCACVRACVCVCVCVGVWVGGWMACERVRRSSRGVAHRSHDVHTQHLIAMPLKSLHRLARESARKRCEALGARGAGVVLMHNTTRCEL